MTSLYGQAAATWKVVFLYQTRRAKTAGIGTPTRLLRTQIDRFQVFDFFVRHSCRIRNPGNGSHQVDAGYRRHGGESAQKPLRLTEKYQAEGVLIHCKGTQIRRVGQSGKDGLPSMRQADF